MRGGCAGVGGGWGWVGGEWGRLRGGWEGLCRGWRWLRMCGLVMAGEEWDVDGNGWQVAGEG